MKWISDSTRRFPRRPFYLPGELDEFCEHTITCFMSEQHGRLILPIPTDTITKLIERDAADLDLYADLSDEGWEIEGVTDFYPSEKPRVRIAKELSEQEWRVHRLRTTLSHEYGHIKLHAPLWDPQFAGTAVQTTFIDLPAPAPPPRCNRAAILDAPKADWMEWQAGYVCGALLMPVTSVRRVLSDFLETRRIYGTIRLGSLKATELQSILAETFDVSEEAARVRLLKLGYLTHSQVSPSLFG